MILQPLLFFSDSSYHFVYDSLIFLLRSYWAIFHFFFSLSYSFGANQLHQTYLHTPSCLNRNLKFSLEKCPEFCSEFIKSFPSISATPFIIHVLNCLIVVSAGLVLPFPCKCFHSFIVQLAVLTEAFFFFPLSLISIIFLCVLIFYAWFVWISSLSVCLHIIFPSLSTVISVRSLFTSTCYLHLQIHLTFRAT